MPAVIKYETTAFLINLLVSHALSNQAFTFFSCIITTVTIEYYLSFYGGLESHLSAQNYLPANSTPALQGE